MSPSSVAAKEGEEEGENSIMKVESPGRKKKRRLSPLEEKGY